MAQTVIGIFDTTVEAEQAIQQLINNGFLRENIQLKSTDLRDLERDDTENSGGVSSFFKNLFSSREEEAEDNGEYLHLARDTKSVVTVNTESKEFAEEAATILDNCGAVNLGDQADKIRASSLNAKATTTNTQNDIHSAPLSDHADKVGASSLTTKATTINTPTDIYEAPLPTVQPIFKEEVSRDKGTKISMLEAYLRVGKREVLVNGTSIRTRIVEQPTEASVLQDTRSLHLDQTFNAQAANADKENFRARSIEFRETKEVPVLRKEARVVEEIRLGKEVYVTTETVSDTVRKTAVEVENLEARRDTDNTRYTNRQDL